HRRHEVRVRLGRGRAAPRDRRDPHARLVALLAGGPLRAGRGAAELRQAAAARLPGGSEAAGEVGRQRTAAAAARGGSAGDERAVSGGVPTDHWEDLGDCVTVRFAPEGWPFIIPGWALVFLGAWVAQGSPWLWVPEVALVLLAVWLLVFFRDPIRVARGCVPSAGGTCGRAGGRGRARPGGRHAAGGVRPVSAGTP